MYKRKGFTLIELLIAIAIIAILAALVMVSIQRRRSDSRLARVTSELSELSTALVQYAEDNNHVYPDDVSRGIPPGLERYLPAGTWPISVWPQGVFDYDNWVRTDAGPNLGKQVYQISYRLCDTNDPISTCSDPILFPNFTRYSSIFYCISGPCVPHRDYPTDPGYCVNCNPKKQNY
jgi:prepilin-type N-terminal cleavage/methylation domain-containing protein